MMHRTRSTDVGASQLIIDGKIKLKNDAQIANFTEKGLEFADGSTLDADAVVFATGYVVCLFCFFVAAMAHVHRLGEARDPMRKILGPEAGARLKQIWGLDSEGEIKGAWRDIGLPRLWCMIGTLFSCFDGEKKTRFLINLMQETSPCVGSTRSILPCVRFSMSTMIGSTCADSMTTEIKAIEEGLFDEKRYSLETPLDE
jgi:hypothetical protein